MTTVALDEPLFLYEEEPNVKVTALPEAARFEFNDGITVTLNRKQISLLHTAFNVLIQAGWTGKSLVDEINFTLDYSKIDKIKERYKEEI